MKKKKSSGKKKGKKKTPEPTGTEPSADPAEEGIDGAPEQETLVGGKKKKGKKGKKGKKKGKLTLAEKRLEKLEKACDDLKNNTAFFDNFLDRMDKWLIETSNKALKLFMKYDENNTGDITYDEMKSGMFDLHVPCNAIEQHLFCQLLDTSNSGMIEYINFELGLHAMRENVNEGDNDDEEDDDDNKGLDEDAVDEGEDIEPIGTPTIIHPPLIPLMRHEQPDHCLCCKMAICLPYVEKSPKYVEILVRLSLLEDMRDNPGHFSQTVHTHLPIIGLIEMIRTLTGLNSTRIGVFLDNSKNAEKLDESKTLDDYEIEGSTKLHPPQVLVYYDYAVEFVDCPLLSCDYYFANDRKG